MIFFGSPKTRIIKEPIPLVNKRKKTIRDEYGREFTGKEFMDVMAECPIMFYDSIGEEFS